MQIDRYFLLNPVEIILARSRPFMLPLSRIFQKPTKKSEAGAPDPSLSSKRECCSFSILAHAVRMSPNKNGSTQNPGLQKTRETPTVKGNETLLDHRR